ncbi:hypothetical protein LINGRAPRIM_LOCUS2674 [Linum grandiflorum]
MKWYLDEDGLPISIDFSPGKTIKSQSQSIESLEKSPCTDNSMENLVDDYIDDVFDESLLPIQVHISDWKLSLDLGAPSSNESLTSSLSEMASDKKSLEDFNSSFRKNDRYILNLDKISGITQPDSCSGPPSVPPQMFDMLPRPQGIVIREPNQEEDYLEQHSPDSVLFKDPSIVLQELTGTSLSQDELIEEQCAIEADLLSQKLNDPSHTLALAFQTVPESFKLRPAISSERNKEVVPPFELSPQNQISDKSIERKPDEHPPEQITKLRTRKRQGASKKEEPHKKQQLESKKVEAASLKWLHPDK